MYRVQYKFYRFKCKICVKLTLKNCNVYTLKVYILQIEGLDLHFESVHFTDWWVRFTP